MTVNKRLVRDIRKAERQIPRGETVSWSSVKRCHGLSRRRDPAIRRAIAVQGAIGRLLSGGQWDSVTEVRRWRDSRRRK